MNEIEKYLKKCKRDIVCIFLGSEKFSLSYSQLHKLSDEIYNATKVSISYSTLKRIFDDNYSGTPQLSTLDAFAKYLGYTDWNEYLRDNTDTPVNVDRLRNKTKKRIVLGTMLFLVGIIVLGIVFLLPKKNDSLENPNYDEIEFSYMPFNESEIPAIVDFKYDLKGIEFDTALLHPIARYGWSNGQDVIQIDQNDSVARYIYLTTETYTPLLTIDGKIAKQLKIRLKTNSWLASLSNEKDGFYVKYFRDKEIFTTGKMFFTNEVLERNNFEKSDIDYNVFDLYRDFEDINGDSLYFITRIRNIPITRSEKSCRAEICLSFDSSMIALPLEQNKSPFNEFWFFPFDNYLSSQKTDLKNLYINLEEWNTVRIETHDKQFKLFINDSLNYQIPFRVNPGKLKGIRLLFKGMGEVDYIKFYNQNSELIFNDEFEK